VRAALGGGLLGRTSHDSPSMGRFVSSPARVYEPERAALSSWERTRNGRAGEFVNDPSEQARQAKPDNQGYSGDLLNIKIGQVPDPAIKLR
jgi:hypothetical protein